MSRTLFRLANPDPNASCRTADCTATWAYDGRDRLISENTGAGTTSAFTLDAVGNVEDEQRNGSTHRSASFTGQRLSTATIDGVAVRYLYDALGNVDCVVLASWVSGSCPAAASGQSVAGELVLDNVYDYRGRLVAARSYVGGSLGDRTEYRYDPVGRPIRKIATAAGETTTTDMVYLGVADGVVREIETGQATKTRSYAFDALGLRATLTEDASRYSYAIDPHGSVEALLDQSNGIKASYGYLAYGEANPALTKTAAGFDASTNTYRYTGKRWDPAAKAYDMGARHYVPSIGHWFQQDQYNGALANLGLSLDPLNANRYLFTGANPINYVEVDGHWAVFYEGGGDYNPTEQANLFGKAYEYLGCGTDSGDAFVCGGLEAAAQEQLDVWEDRDALCDQTRKAQHCAASIDLSSLASKVASTVAAAQNLSVSDVLRAIDASAPYVFACAQGAAVSAIAGPFSAGVGCAVGALTKYAETSDNRNVKILAAIAIGIDSVGLWKGIRMAQKDPARPFELWREFVNGRR